jgi:hypothetical protein
VNERKIGAKFEDLKKVGCRLNVLVDVFVLGEVAEWGTEGDMSKYIASEVLGEASEVDWSVPG